MNNYLSVKQDIKQKQEYRLLDLAKLIFAISIVFFHATSRAYSYPAFLFYNGFVRLGVPFFFMTSGFFYIKRRNYVKQKSKYLFGLIKKYAIYFVLYIPIGILMLESANVASGRGFIWLDVINAIFITGSGYHLWYVPALIFSIIVLEFCLKHNLLKKLLGIAGFFYLIGCVESYYSLITYTFPNLGIYLDTYFSYFYTTRNGLFFGLIFVAIGAKIASKEREIKGRAINTKLIIFSLLFLYECTIFYLMDPGIDYNFYLSLIPISTVLFISLMKGIEIKKQILPKGEKLRKVSTGIYFNHLFALFAVDLIYQKPDMIKAIMTLLLTMIICKLVS
jgi:surface polysaccharide O-acyltransferase-like enzyme